MTYDSIACGKRIKEARHKLGFTQLELSDLLSISPKYLSRIETGAQTASFELMVTISKTLHVSFDYLLFGKQPLDIKLSTVIKSSLYEIIQKLDALINCI